ncbi:MAG: hypothetical protein GXP14_17295 [Gammaproteobacteria bacterium]|nr:hypothetical protein [Gammaproteobacteria bacterium]
MNEKLKKRIVGGVVLVALGVIAIPMFSSDEAEITQVKESIIPPKPQLEMQTSTVDLKAWSQNNVSDEGALGSTGALGSSSDDDLLSREIDRSVLTDAPAVDPAVNREKTTAVNIVSTQPEVKNEVQQHASVQPVVTQPKETQQPAIKTTNIVKVPPPVIVKPQPQVHSVKAGSSSAWVVQVGSFRKKENAERLREKLKQLGYRAFVSTSNSGGKVVVRVRIGPQMAKASAKKVKSRIEQQMKMQAMLVKLK